MTTSSNYVTQGFFKDGSIHTVPFKEWVNAALGQGGDNSYHVALPLIQRGSVWAPHKILDLWDTLLRGMPIGAMMATESVGNAVNLGQKVQVDSKELARSIGLIDGQQRTLAMLAGFKKAATFDRAVTIWIDLADDAPPNEYQYRLWITTRNQPFGYERQSTGGQALGKLSKQDLRLADFVYHNDLVAHKGELEQFWALPGFMPWKAKFAVRLADLMDGSIDLNKIFTETKQLHEKFEQMKPSVLGEEDYLKAIRKNLSARSSIDLKAIEQRAQLIQRDLKKLDEYQFPIIQVDDNLFATPKAEEKPVDNQNGLIDPPLAILFKRVGTGGVPLSNSDYVYSVIKQMAPETYQLVEGLLNNKQFSRFSAIFTPTSLVMSAVRMTILWMSLAKGDDKKLADTPAINKAEFARLIHTHENFKDQFVEQIKDGKFVTHLSAILNALAYVPGGHDVGFPKHALYLIDTSLLEVLLAWAYLGKLDATHDYTASKMPMVRFLLWGHLAIMKKPEASKECIKQLKKLAANDRILTFPDQSLIEHLCSEDGKKLGLPMPKPTYLSKIEGLTHTPDTPLDQGNKVLRGNNRFSAQKEEIDQQAVDIYHRWWGHGRHIHPMLLWLQRDYVYSKFEKEPVLPGMEDDTPYDYDHILPTAHWSYWTGQKNVKGKLIDFHSDDADKTSHWVVGNAIGNIHVLDGSENRSLGDTPPDEKIKNPDMAKNALIDVKKQGKLWGDASRSKEHGKDLRFWDRDRAANFQRAVETRTFALYEKFYQDLEIDRIMGNAD
ncbi:MAG TPA: DUF262 domain-containing protein [Halothiobacillus sp.]|nr:DUF262 domain-containing protein [Halothiobacillus sp.]